MTDSQEVDANPTMSSSQQPLPHCATGGRQHRHTPSPAAARSGHVDDTGPVVRPLNTPVAAPNASQQGGKRNGRQRQQRTAPGGASPFGGERTSIPKTQRTSPSPAAAAVQHGQPSQRCSRQRRSDITKCVPQHQSSSAFPAPSSTTPQQDFRPSLGGSKSRKRNMNHLLQFTVARGNEHDELPSLSGGSYGSGGGRSGRHSSFYNKEHYLQANCQFVVTEGNYSEFTSSLDPDRLVNWDAVQQVKLLRHQEELCTICLDTPRAAKITRCGHIYCWTCMLQYLDYASEDERSWKKCPMCHEAVHKKDLKSVSVSTTRQVSVGDEMTFSLVKRQELSSLVMPHLRDGEQTSSGDFDRFTKLLPVHGDCILARVVSRERAELEQLLVELEADVGSELQIPSAKQALEVCRDRQHLLELSTPSASPKESPPTTPTTTSPGKDSSSSTPKSASPQQPSPPHEIPAARRDSYAARIARRRTWDDDSLDGSTGISTKSEDNVKEASTPAAGQPPSRQNQCDCSADVNTGVEACEARPDPASSAVAGDSPGAAVSSEEASGTTPASAVSPPKSKSKSPSSSSSASNFKLVPGQGTVAEVVHYLYQASDGQHVYLHPFSAFLLKEEYHGLDQAPLSLTARVVELETKTMSQGLRKRYVDLSHLPLTCQFTLCYLDVKPLLSKATIDAHADELEKREQLRRRRRQDEKKKERRRAVAEARASKTAGYQNPLYRPMEPSLARDIPSASSSSASSSRHRTEEDALRAGIAASLAGGDADSAGSLGSSASSSSTPLSSSLQDDNATFNVGSPSSSAQLSYSRVTNSASTASAPAWPAPQTSSFASALRSADGKPSAAPSHRRGNPRSGIVLSSAWHGGDAGGGSDDEPSYVPSFQDSFTDSLALDIEAKLAAVNAAAAATTQSDPSATDAAAPAAGGGKKKGKKRKPQVLLFSTNSRHGN